MENPVQAGESQQGRSPCRLKCKNERAVAEDFWCFACSVQRVWTLFEGEARKITPAASSPPPCVLIEPMAGYDKVPAEWSRPTTWPARKRLPERGPDAPHVVLSTKFGEPWYSISMDVKEVLEELGCTVYNPNTDWQQGKAQRV